MNDPNKDSPQRETIDDDPSSDPAYLAAEDIDEVIDDKNDVNEDNIADNMEDMDLDAMATNSTDKDSADLVFTQHKEAVFCVRLDPNTCTLAVTGGQDDRAFVWSTQSGQICFECTGHSDSVTNVGFSHDGQFVASADMSGLVKVWNVSTQQQAWEFQCSDIEWIRWHHSAHILLVGTSDGEVWMWKIPSGECKTFQTHGAPASCGAVMPDGKRCCVGYEDGAVKVWDLKAGAALQNINGYDAHQSSVVALDCHHENTVIVTGSTDVTAKLLNTNTGKVLSTFKCDKAPRSTGDTDDSVETVAFSKSFPYLATGTLQGILGIWDVATQTHRQSCVHPAGIVKLQWDATSPLVYTACLDGTLRLWDARSATQVATWSGHEKEVLDFDVARDGSILVSCAEDGTARIHSIHTPDR